MDEAAALDDVRLFIAHAGNDAAVWKMIDGQQVTHTKEGVGTIIRTWFKAEPTPTILLFVRFHEDGKEMKFHGEALAGRWFSDVQLPPGVLPELEQMRERLQEERRRREEHAERHRKHQAELRKQQQEHAERQREQQERERECAKEFADLKERYGAKGYRSANLSDWLYPVLLRIDQGELLLEKDVDWLKSRRLYGVLATYYQENEYRRRRDAWALVKASGYWRNTREPRKALGVTEPLLEGKLAPKIGAAVLTTRGGAFRDLLDLDAAERCAREAIKLDRTSYYPYNLLGAVYWLRGEAEKGHECFVRAMELGAPLQDQVRQQESAMREIDPQQRRDVAKYLLERDPAKYGWADHHLE